MILDMILDMIGNTGNTDVHTMQGCTPRKVRGILMAKRTKSNKEDPGSQAYQSLYATPPKKLG